MISIRSANSSVAKCQCPARQIDQALRRSGSASWFWKASWKKAKTASRWPLCLLLRLDWQSMRRFCASTHLVAMFPRLLCEILVYGEDVDPSPDEEVGLRLQSVGLVEKACLSTPQQLHVPVGADLTQSPDQTRFRVVKANFLHLGNLERSQVHLPRYVAFASERIR
ncbi:unnamed protein product [Periconia digitata]|uniref:Uncharacterized protein n=1 Tax=Periconia digitata TaxID=1303443 RepID=A0A9W4XZ10_9PLEO|nr:unnamed protein product [Periconia digitata]